jgi:hypothetical protein
MDGELFTSFVHHFHDYIKEKGIPLPVILFVDGQSTPMSLPTALFCSENGIILYCLLENATHMIIYVPKMGQRQKRPSCICIKNIMRL